MDVTKNKKIYRKLGVYDLSEFSSLMPEQIRRRGERYFNEGKVNNISEKDKVFKATVTGTKDYDVVVSLDKDKIKECSCTCEYYKDGNKYCKHIYALIVYIFCEGDLEKAEEKLSKKLDQVCNMIEFLEGKVNLYINKQSINHQNEIINTINEWIHWYNGCKDFYQSTTLEMDYVNIYEDVLNLYKYIQNSYKKVLDERRNNDTTSVGFFKRIYNFLAETGAQHQDERILHYSHNNEVIKDNDGNPLKNTSEFTDEEIDQYCLNDEERAEVYRGNFAPWDFSEEDRDEDAYYWDGNEYEDDIYDPDQDV